MSNATFTYFKASGKFYDRARGVVDPDLFRASVCPDADARRARILALNGGLAPGLSTTGEGYTVMVDPDAELDCGWPLLLPHTAEKPARLLATFDPIHA